MHRASQQLHSAPCDAHHAAAYRSTSAKPPKRGRWGRGMSCDSCSARRVKPSTRKLHELASKAWHSKQGLGRGVDEASRVGIAKASRGTVVHLGDIVGVAILVCVLWTVRAAHPLVAVDKELECVCAWSASGVRGAAATLSVSVHTPGCSNRVSVHCKR